MKKILIVFAVIFSLSLPVAGQAAGNSAQSQSGNLKNLGAKAYILGFYHTSVVGLGGYFPQNALYFCKNAVIKLSSHNQSYLTEQCVKGAVDSFKLGYFMNKANS